MLVCAVYVPLFRSRVTLFTAEIGPLQSWLGPAGSRVVNVALHALTSVVVYQLGRKLTRSTAVAFWAALFFAIHPAHVDAVARVTGSMELLPALILLALVLTLLHVPQIANRYWAAHACLLSAPVLWLAFRYQQTGGQWDTPSAIAAEPASSRFLTGINVLGRYLKLLVWPYRLSPDYSYNAVPAVTNPWSPHFVVPLVCILAVLALAVLRARREPGYVLSCAFLLLCALPVWGFGAHVMAERFLYFPSAAFCWMLALLFRDAGLIRPFDWRDRRVIRPVILLVVFLALPWGAKTYLRNGQWRDEKLLLRQAALTVPGNARIHLLLGDYYVRQRDYLGAERSYRRALDIDGGYDEARLKLAAAYRQSGMFAKALETARQVAGPDDQTKARRAAEIARTHVALDDYARAAGAFEEALRYDERDAAVQRELGTLYLHFLAEPDRGRRHLRRSLELDPGQPAAADIRELLARP